MATTVKWFPPAWLQVKTSQTVIYVDPAYLSSYFTRHPKKIEFSKWPDPIDGLPEELEPADLILLTHDHKDHAKEVTLRRLMHRRTRIVAPQRCADKIDADIQIIAPSQELRHKGFHVKAVPAYNTRQGHSTRKVHHKGLGVGYLISHGSHTLYHAGDTDLIPEMLNLGTVRIAFLPIGGTYTMDIEEALKAAIAIQPKFAVPIHRAKADPQVFKQKLEAVSIITVLPLSIGEAIQL